MAFYKNVFLFALCISVILRSSSSNNFTASGESSHEEQPLDVQPLDDFAPSSSILSAVQALEPCNKLFRVMTFNIWKGGSEVTDGPKKIAKHILLKNPDIVAIQDIDTVAIIPLIQGNLGPTWTIHYQECYDGSTVGVITKHTIVATGVHCMSSAAKVKVNIKLTNMSSVNVSVWSIQLPSGCYGPHLACNKLITAPTQIEACEVSPLDQVGRVKLIGEILKSEEFMNDSVSGDLTIVAGTFNSPSHLDWTPSTESSHCGWTMEWPATRMLTDISYVDAYRKVFPDPASAPGETWSPVQKYFYAGSDTFHYLIPEPQDRVDMIFYKGNPNQWTVRDAEVYWGKDKLHVIPNHRNNDWPSNHASVIADFQFLCKRGGGSGESLWSDQ